MSEIKNDLKWGLQSPLSYYDSQYDTQLSFRAVGNYSAELIDQAVIDGYNNGAKNDYNEYEGEKIFPYVENVVHTYLANKATNASTLDKIKNSINYEELLAQVNSYVNSHGFRVISLSIEELDYTEESKEIINTGKKKTTTSDVTTNTTSKSDSKATVEVQKENKTSNNNTLTIIGIGFFIITVIILIIVIITRLKKKNTSSEPF